MEKNILWDNYIMENLYYGKNSIMGKLQYGKNYGTMLNTIEL